MATSEAEQKSINVPQHKRLAMGEKITGQSLKSGGGNGSKPQGGLAQAKKK